MKIALIMLYCVIIVNAIAQPSKKDCVITSIGRCRINFNRDWKFKLGDFNGAEEKQFNDSGWQHIGLPHSFSIPYFMSPDFYIGYGWYRKEFNVPYTYKGKHVCIEFEAAFQDAEIYINGKKAGNHKGGYTGFSIDITNTINIGRNIVAVRLNNIWNPTLAPRAGEHVFSGGLYRDVYLVITSPVHVDWYGTFISTPEVSEEKANINIKTDVRNTSNKVVSVELQTDILSPDGKNISRIISRQNILPNGIATFDQTSKTLFKPRLWDISSPSLYTAVSNVIVNGKKQDEYHTQFGIRSVIWTKDKGFFLNGKHLYLRGANVHQDHAGWGDAVTNAGFFRDVQMMKDAGFNFIRGSHYPHDPAFAQACDELGVLFWSENPFWGIGGSSSTPEGYWNSSAYPTKDKDRLVFENNIIQQLKEMIHIYRNNPSVIAWSVCNEPFFTADSTIPLMRNLLKKLISVTHKTDPTRVAAIGGAQRPLDENRIDTIGDIAGYNGDGSSIPLFQNPGKPTVVSEYGSTTAERPGNYEPGWGDLTVDKGLPIHEWRSGQAIWCGFDHGSIAGPRLGKMGIVDYFRIPKKAWYWYRNEYAHISPPEWAKPGIPAKLRLEADRKYAKIDGTEDVKLLVTVLDADGNHINNTPPVTFTIISGPGEFPTGSSILFEEKSDIRISNGQAAIEMRSWHAGKTIVRASSPGIQSSDILIEFVGNIPYLRGVTPLPTERPYIRFYKKNQQKVSQQFGQNNPSFCSSFINDHPSGFAADGNKATWWQPLPSDKNPYWILDTEKKLNLLSINIIFPVGDIYQFKVEASEDNKEWVTVGDFINNNDKIDSKRLILSDITGGIIRISFANAKMAKLSEVIVVGNVIE